MFCYMFIKYNNFDLGYYFIGSFFWFVILNLLIRCAEKKMKLNFISKNV